MLYDANHALLSTSIPGLPEPKRGKVRDVYDLGDRILFVATDRISAFDCVMPNGIPDKGILLTQISRFWFKRLTGIPNHLLSADCTEFPPMLQDYRQHLEGRSLLVRKLRILPVECVVRGYMSGSGWQEYRQSATVCGISLPPGYVNAAKLQEPIFTPTTKEDSGHDQPLSYPRLADRIGAELAGRLRSASLALYRQAADYALGKGIIIADTKFEFGLDEQGQLVLADEVLTPDSSRFWPVESYQPGQNPPSLDKQYVRDWLDSVHFNHQPPAPELPLEVVLRTREKYRSALAQLQKDCP
ncbi:MAG: phosphoribosylaminoimidazolesuccinocarboxamide synthase [Oligosphaeraceae bacterium]|nr:phosphoribosylaminoimidazolesuccinocarboxamide synthase [Oligosphaeraceae bacterium]